MNAKITKKSSALWETYKLTVVQNYFSKRWTNIEVVDTRRQTQLGQSIAKPDTLLLNILVDNANFK